MNRIVSIDVLRGLTVALMILVNSPGSWTYVYKPLLHAEWHLFPIDGLNFPFADLVFPFFLFTIGLSMAISMKKVTEFNSKTWIKLLKRSAVLFGLGLLLKLYPFFNLDLESIQNLRIFGVLQRIALSSALAGTILLFFQNKNSRILSVITLLLGYWLILFLGGDYSLQGNLNLKIDKLILLDNNMYKGYGIPFDPEGLLAVIPCAAQIIIGFLVSKYFIISEKVEITKGLILGILMFILGLIWNIYFPINKPIWTSSYVLFTSGLACLLTIFLAYSIDLKNTKFWILPFKVFGMNTLFSYILSGIVVKTFGAIKIGEKSLSSIIYNQFFSEYFGLYFGSFLYAIFIVLIVYLFSYILYKKNILIKV